jgi:hypothetical protein
MGGDISSGQVLEPADFFVVRVPALPFSTLTDWSAGVEARRAAAAELTDRRDATPAEPAHRQLAAALVHGWVNRMMRSRDRAHEWAIYELLRRSYEASVHLR